MELTGIQMVIAGSALLVAVSLGFISGAVYALSSVRKAIDGTKRVRQ